MLNEWGLGNSHINWESNTFLDENREERLRERGGKEGREEEGWGGFREQERKRKRKIIKSGEYATSYVRCGAPCGTAHLRWPVENNVHRV